MHFFHRFVSFRKKQNSIWEITTEEGLKVTAQSKIKKVAADYFRGLFKDPGRADICSQLKVLKYYPTFFSLEEGSRIGNHISLDELK